MPLYIKHYFYNFMKLFPVLLLSRYPFLKKKTLFPLFSILFSHSTI